MYNINIYLTKNFFKKGYFKLMKNILFFYKNAFSQTGGIQTFNKYFISALEGVGYNVNLVSLDDESSDIKSNLPFVSLEHKKLNAFKYILKHHKKYDTFIFSHINFAPLAIFLYILNRNAKIFFITHGIEVWKELPKTTQWIMNKSTILTVSNFSKNELKKYNSRLRDIKLFPNCIKLQNQNIELKNPYDDNSFNILSVTRLSKSEQLKGIDSIIKTLPILKDKIPNIKYNIIGKGEDTIRLKKLADELKVSKYVNFLGFVKDINEYYKYCDIFTLPSKKEGFGIVYLEAMQYKKPVVAVNYGGVTDVVIDDKTGYLCSYNDINCLSEKIYNLYLNPKLRKRLGENGYRHLIDNFTFDLYANRLKELL